MDNTTTSAGDSRVTAEKSANTRSTGKWTERRIKRLMASARKFAARRLTRAEDREDYVQYVMLRIVAMGSQATLKQILIDFYRMNFGATKDDPRDAMLSLRVEPGYDLEAIGRIEERMPAHVMLTPNERKVLYMGAGGFTIDEIAELLRMSPKTVNVHVANMRKKVRAGGD